MFKYLCVILLLLFLGCVTPIYYYESTDTSLGVGEPDKTFIEINEKRNSAILRLRFNYNYPSKNTIHKVNYVQFDCHALKRDSLFVFILGNFQYENRRKELISSYAETYFKEQCITKELCPYIVAIKQNDSLIIRNISDDMILFLELNGLIEKNKYIIGDVFPGILILANRLPNAFLPKQSQDDKNEIKRIKKKLLLGLRCVNL